MEEGLFLVDPQRALAGKDTQRKSLPDYLNGREGSWWSSHPQKGFLIGQLNWHRKLLGASGASLKWA